MESVRYSCLTILLFAAVACSTKSTARGFPVDGGGTSGVGGVGGSGGAAGASGSAGSGGASGSAGGGTDGASGTGGTIGTAGAAGASGTAGTSGSGGAAGGDAGGGSGYDCGRVSAAQCDRLNQCYPYVVSIGYGSLEKCVEALAAQCTQQLAASDATVPTAADCAATISGIGCDQLLGGSDPAGCARKGTRANGRSCAFGSQCASGLCYRPPGEGRACGVCSAYVLEGGDCSMGYCEAGTQCVNNRCVREAAQDAACGVTQLCQARLACVDGRCTSPLPLGAQCDGSPSACASLAGQICLLRSNGSSVCTQSQVVGPPARCGLVNTEFYQCRGDAFCSSAMNSVCVARPIVGQSCSIATGSACVFPAECINGTCRHLDGAACN